jgi:hypothetical protein
MFVPSRSRRRYDRLRLRQRMVRLWKDLYAPGDPRNAKPDPDPTWLGNMISTDGKPCSCSLGCGNRRKWDGPTLAERIADDALRDIVISDAGLLAYRELDDALRLSELAGKNLADSRTGRNGRDDNSDPAAELQICPF